MSGAEHRLVELAPRDAVAVLAAVRALVLADEIETFLGDCTHPLDVRPILHVEDRAHMQAAHRRVRVPGAARSVALEDRIESLGIVRQVLERHGGVLDEGDRFAVAFHRHHDVEARFAHFGDRSLERGLCGPDHAMREAEIAHEFLEPRELRKQRLVLDAMELDDQEALEARRSPCGRSCCGRSGCRGQGRSSCDRRAQPLRGRERQYDASPPSLRGTKETGRRPTLSGV